MHELRVSVAVFLLANVLTGLVRVAKGPTLADRILVSQLFGTTGVAVLLLLAPDQGRGPLRNVALVFALLAAVTVVAFVRITAREDRRR
jgi:multicomponent Na+:H+ antiporter subunit F